MIASSRRALRSLAVAASLLPFVFGVTAARAQSYTGRDRALHEHRKNLSWFSRRDWVWWWNHPRTDGEYMVMLEEDQRKVSRHVDQVIEKRVVPALEMAKTPQGVALTSFAVLAPEIAVPLYTGFGALGTATEYSRSGSENQILLNSLPGPVNAELARELEDDRTNMLAFDLTNLSLGLNESIAARGPRESTFLAVGSGFDFEPLNTAQRLRARRLESSPRLLLRGGYSRLPEAAFEGGIRSRAADLAELERVPLARVADDSLANHVNFGAIPEGKADVFVSTTTDWGTAYTAAGGGKPLPGSKYNSGYVYYIRNANGMTIDAVTALGQEGVPHEFEFSAIGSVPREQILGVRRVASIDGVWRAVGPIQRNPYYQRFGRFNGTFRGITDRNARPMSPGNP